MAWRVPDIRRGREISVGAYLELDDTTLIAAISEYARGPDPVPVDAASRLRTAPAAAWPQALRPGAIALHTEHAPEDRRRAASSAGVQLVEVEADERGRVAIQPALLALGRLPIRSLLVEGGGHLLASFVAAAAWDRWYWFQAPRLLGDGAPVLPGLSWSAVAHSPRLWLELRSRVGGDELMVLQPESPAAGP